MDEQTLINFIHAVLGGGAASTIVIGVAKLIFQSFLKTLQDSAEALKENKIDISVQNVKLDNLTMTLDKISVLIQEHDKDIAIIMERLDRGKVRDIKTASS